MSANAFKRLNISDTFVVPYTANKSWDISSSSFAAHQINTNIGVNYSGTIFNPNAEYYTNGQYDRLVYESVNTVYYPTFLSKVVSTQSLQNTIYNDGTLSTSSYWKGANALDPGNLDTIKFFPTGYGDVIYVLNVPKNLTGDKILPATFEVSFTSEAAAVKARWLGNFCPRQPVYRALKRQRSSRDRRLRSGRARWKPQSIRTRIAVTAFIPGCSLTALRALGETE
jgi:hypothetical protein